MFPFLLLLFFSVNFPAATIVESILVRKRTKEKNTFLMSFGFKREIYTNLAKGTVNRFR